MARIPITPEALLELAAVYRRQAAAMRDEAEALEVRADGCELAAGKLPGLPRGRRMGTVGTDMEAQARSRGAAISDAKTKAKTLFQASLRARGASIPEWVGIQAKRGYKGLSVEAVKSWCKKPGHGGRPVPRVWAERIAAEFEQPPLADPDSWPNGIREKL